MFRAPGLQLYDGLLTGAFILSVIVWSVMLVQPSTGHAANPDWLFSDELRSRLVFVHPLVNYAVNPVWQRDWERQLARANGVQVSSGSVATEDLYTDLTVNITEQLSEHFRFLYRLVWREGLHLDFEQQEHWLGFEAALFRGLAAYLQTHPSADKEELDLSAGLLLTDRTRERYLRLGLRLDDFMYERKNDLGGTSTEERVGIQWELRLQSGRWEVFSSGGYGSGSRRAFPDSTSTPVVTGSFRNRGTSTFRLRHVWSDLDFAEAGLLHYRFDATEQRRDGATGFDYSNEFVHLRGLGVLRVGGPWSLRPEINWLRQWAYARGRRTFDHRREDFFPALFVELRAPGNSTWDLGYMASHYQWDHSTGASNDNRAGYTDKIKLGWTYAFRPTARAQFSLSHELDFKRFGGGNVQYQMNF